MIDVYNREVNLIRDFIDQGGKPEDYQISNTNLHEIKWSSSLDTTLKQRKLALFEDNKIIRSVYRPFGKQWVYFDKMMNHRTYQMQSIFGKNGKGNLSIVMTGVGAGKEFSVLIVDSIPNLHTLDTSQCFPLYLYESTETANTTPLFPAASLASPARRDAITDASLAHFQAAYPAPGEGNSITKEDLFYYIYGLLHSPDYRSRYADNLGKELPRIPAVKAYADFRAFSRAGRDLAHWHLNYETVAIHPGAVIDSGKTPLSSLRLEDYRVVKMKFAKTRDPETNKSVPDKTTVIYNERLTIRHIPLEAYDYVVNGKPALEWVMERQSVTTDKASNITNDANLWATETMGDAKYPLELFLRVITVSLETNKIVAGLPELEIG